MRLRWKMVKISVFSKGFWNTNGSPNPSWKNIPNDNKNKGTNHVVDFVIPVDHKIKIEETEKEYKYLDRASELKKKKLRKMKLRVISIISSAVWKVSKVSERGLEKFEIGERVKIIQITAFLRSARIQRRFWRPEDSRSRSNSSERSSANDGGKKNLKGEIILILIFYWAVFRKLTKIK